MTDPVIERRSVGAVTVLELRHGPVNALDLEFCRAITAELSAATGALVLTGAGRAFSAGVDLSRLLTGGAAYVGEFLPALDELFRTAFSLPVPLVAAVNGHAIAGGAILAAAADVVLMSSGQATFGVPELELGVSLPQSAFEVVRSRVGETRTRDVILTARNHSPAEATQLGLVDEVVEDDVVARAVAVAERFATRMPLDAFALTKEQLRGEARRRIEAAPLDETLRLWCRRLEDGWITRHLEAVRARGSRRRP